MNIKLKKLFVLLVILITISVSTSKSQTNDSIQFEYLLDLTLEELLELKVVSAGKTAQTINESPAIISVITAEQIQLRGYTNLAMLLNSLPGIYVLDDNLQYNAGIRGINSGMESWSRVFKLMIDNQPVSFRSTAENWLGKELIPMSAIERVEIVRGPLSTIYGANAFLGVVNIITKKGENIDGLHIIAGGNLVENNLGYDGEIAVGKKFNNIDFIITYSKNYIDKSGIKIKNMQDENIYSEDLTNNIDVNRSQSVFAKASINMKKYGTFQLSYSLQNLDNYAQFQNWSILSDSNRIVMNNSYIKAKYTNKYFNNNLVWNLSFAYTTGEPSDKQLMYVKKDIKSIGEFIKRDVGFNSYDFAGDISYVFKTKSSISFGLDHTIDLHNLQTYYAKDNQQNYTLPLQSKIYGDTTFVNAGIYFIGTFYPFKVIKFAPFQNFSLSGAIRQDFQNIYGRNTSFRYGLIMPVNNNLYFKLLYGNSYKEPASVQLYTNAIYTMGIIGNDQLKVEKAESYEFVTGLIINDNISIIISPFYSKITDKVEIVPHFSNMRATNIANINCKGAETELQLFSKNISTYLNISYQKSLISEPDAFNPSKIIQKQVRLFPKLMIKTGINIPIRKIKTNINIEGKYIDKIIASPQNLQVYDPVFLTEEYTLPSYFICDLTISSIQLYVIKQKETTLQLRISNILNNQYFMPGFKDYDIYGYSRAFQFKLIQKF